MRGRPANSSGLLVCATLAVAAVQAVGATQPARVTVVGAAAMVPFVSAVADAFGRQGTWRTPIIQSVGTGEGLAQFCAGDRVGTPDIADASRAMNEDERQACLRNRAGEIVAVRIGYDGMVIANSREGPHFDLTRARLYRALAKTVVVHGRLAPNPYQRWNDVDPSLPSRPIMVLGPAPNFGTRDALVALALVPPCMLQPEIRELSPPARARLCETIRADGAWIEVASDYEQVVGRLVRDPAAVAVIPFAYLDRHRDRIQAASVDGVLPSMESIASWTYPLSRPLFLYVKKNHVGLVPGLAEFVQEFLSERAAGPDGYLVEKGLVPQPRGYLAEERSKALIHLGGARQ